MTPSHEEQLQRLLAVVQQLDRGTPRANRAPLLEARPGEPMVFDLLAEGRYARALESVRAAGARARAARSVRVPRGG